MKQIKLSRGMFAIVDDDYFDYLNQWKWHVTEHDKGRFYAERSAKISERLRGAPKHIYMHNVVNNTPRGLFTDHINHNTLDNRSSNLRAVTKKQSAHNIRKHTDGKSKYKGVFKNKKRWMSRIKANGKMIYLGTFDTQEEAAKAYNDAAIIYHGEFASLNAID